jgi:hypothetical protein
VGSAGIFFMRNNDLDGLAEASLKEVYRLQIKCMVLLRAISQAEKEHNIIIFDGSGGAITLENERCLECGKNRKQAAKGCNIPSCRPKFELIP